MKRLVKIAKEHNLYLNEVINLANYERKKLYERYFRKSILENKYEPRLPQVSSEDLNDLDDQAYSIVERYYEKLYGDKE